MTIRRLAEGLEIDKARLLLFQMETEQPRSLRKYSTKKGGGQIRDFEAKVLREGENGGQGGVDEGDGAIMG